MISEEMLRNAAIEADHVLMDSISQLEECHEFSPHFEHNMKRIIRRAKHPLLYGSLKKVACFVMVLLISGSVFLTVNVEARDAFVGWLREAYEMFFVYHYDGEYFEDQLPKQYHLSWLPEGYTEFERFEDAGNTTICYVDDSGHLLSFSYLQNSVDSAWYIDVENAAKHSAHVGSVPAEVFIFHASDVSNVIVWKSEDNNTLFRITAFLEEADLIRMAESVTAS